MITLNGEAKAVMQDIKSYEQTQETMVLMKVLALGQGQIEEGSVQPAADVASCVVVKTADYVLENIEESFCRLAGKPE